MSKRYRSKVDLIEESQASSLDKMQLINLLGLLHGVYFFDFGIFWLIHRGIGLSLVDSQK